MIGIGFAPTACPTARAWSGLPMSSAIRPYDTTLPYGTFRSRS